MTVRSAFVVAWILAFGAAPQAPAQAVKELVGHKEAVATVAFSPDGKTIATGSFDKQVKLWDAATQKEVRALDGHTGMVLSLAFTKDGSRLLTAGEDKLLKVWNLAGTTELRSLPAAPAPIRALAATKDGKALVLVSEDGVVRLVDSTSGAVVGEFKGHAGPVYAAVFSPDGARLYTSGADRTVRLWDVARRKEAASFEAGSQPAAALAVSPKEDALYLGLASGQISRWTLPITPVRSLAGHDAEIQKLRLHPAGALLLSVGANKTVRIHDVASGNMARAITSPAAVLDIAVSPADANMLAVAGDDKVVRVFNIADGAAVGNSEPLAQAATAVTFTPDGKGLILGQADGSIVQLAFPFQPELAIRPAAVHDGTLTAFSRPADGSLILTAGEDKTIRLWNGAGEPIRAFALFAPIRSATLSPNKQLLAAVGGNNELRVWNVNGQELKVIPNVAGPAAFSADGKWMAVAGVDNKVYLHSTAFNADAKPVAAHASAVRAIVFTPAGNAVLSAGADKVLKISDVATAKEVASLAGHQGAITSIDVSADGKSAVTGGEDKNALLWDLAGGKSSGVLAGATAPVLSVAFSPDGGKVAVGSADNNVRIYKAGALVSTIAHPAPVGVGFAVDNIGLVTASSDKNLRFLTPNPPKLIAKHGAKVNGVKTSADGKLVISAGDDQNIRVWDATNGAAVRAMAHTGPVTDFTLSPDGAKIVSGSADKTCRVWNLADGKQLASFPATNAVDAVAVSKDGIRIAFSSADNLVRAVDFAGNELGVFTIAGARGVALGGDNLTVLAGSTDKVLRAGKLAKTWLQMHAAPATALAASADGAKVISAAGDNVLAVRNAADGAVLKSVAVPAPAAISLAADNVRLAVGGGDKVVRLIDVNAGASLQDYPAQDAPVTAVAISADGKTIASANAAGVVSFWSTIVDKTPGALLQKYPRPGPASACVFLPDNKTIATATADKIIRLFETPPPAVTDLAGHAAQIYGVAVSADNKLAASTGADNKVLLWDLTTLKASKTLEGHKAQVYCAAFSPDGKLLATGSGDKTVILWDLATGKPARTITGPLDAIYQVSFTPDGKHIIAGGVDKVPRLWEVATGKEVRAFAGQPDEVYGLELSPNAKRFGTSGYTGGVIVWDLESGKQLYTHKLSFGAFDLAYSPDGNSIVVADNDKKAYLIEIPAAAR